MFDARYANYGKRCSIVESLLQFSEPRRVKFPCQNCKKLLHNTKYGMKRCFGGHKWWATMSIFHYLKGKWMMPRKTDSTLQFLMSPIRASFSTKYNMHEMDKHPYKAQCSKRKNHLNYLQVAFRITSLFVLTNFEVKYLSQHIGYQNKYCKGKSSRLEYYSKWPKYYFLIKIS